MPSLASVDACGRVIYSNTFSMGLGSALRLAYMVLPPQLARRYAGELGFYSSTVGTIDQLALARILADGSYERHVARVRGDLVGDEALMDLLAVRTAPIPSSAGAENPIAS